MNGLSKFLAHPWAAYLMALPGTVLFATLNPDEFIGMRAFGGWPLLCYVLYFLAGFQIASGSGLQDSLRRQRRLSLAAASVILIGLLGLRLAVGDGGFGTPQFIVMNAMYSLLSWSIILAILGYSFERLNFNRPFLKYANEAVLPFYILHQTVILGLGYFVVQWSIPDWLKYLVIAASSFIVCIGLYETVVRRFNLLRVLFGMKPMARSVVVKAVELTVEREPI